MKIKKCKKENSYFISYWQIVKSSYFILNGGRLLLFSFICDMWEYNIGYVSLGQNDYYLKLENNYETDFMIAEIFMRPKK